MTDNKSTTLRDRVISVALGLFFKHGLRAVRMDDVARECGISKRTLYEIFKDRDQLIFECIVESTRKDDEQNRLIAQDAENVLHAFWLMFSQNRKRHRGDAAIVGELQRYYPEVLRRIMMNVHEKMVMRTREDLQKGVDDGLIISSLDLDFFSRALTNYIYGLGIIEQNTSITGVVLNDQSIPYAVVIFLRGISTEKGMRYINEHIIKTE